MWLLGHTASGAFVNIPACIWGRSCLDLSPWRPSPGPRPLPFAALSKGKAVPAYRRAVELAAGAPAAVGVPVGAAWTIRVAI